MEEEKALAYLEAEPILINETILGCLKYQHKQELLEFYNILPLEEKAGMMIEKTGEIVEESKEKEWDSKMDTKSWEAAVYNDFHC